ncbi:hypothetical protein [Phenylobacterium sp.]|uniref:hypothetical protein n=1 Tax=Phenylobacterium sp. TaxID=1871053 RepID=UPI0025CF6A92|nr:hypothetical protein [Phenylobacterium sp.]MBX3485347.1 hypothetical protein [Phenylobacterium sp.]MCW5760014.1 hypothetical protein [Phenylobacterium sp.]
MRKILISSALVLSLCGGAQALAATKSTPATAQPAAAAAADSKASDCAKQWKAEKKHTQTRKAFMAACAKG